MWEEPLNQIRTNFEKELQDCIKDNIDPYCHAANWNHFKGRVVRELGSVLKSLQNENHKQIQAEMDNILRNMKFTVEQWLGYYKQHNEDGCYDSWLERFWIEEKPDEETEEKYYMARIYEKFVKEEIIEIYYFRFASDKTRRAFLNKWYQKYGFHYSENEELDLYIGQKGKTGEFYENIGDFFEPVDSPKESDWWQLVKNILQDTNS